MKEKEVKTPIPEAKEERCSICGKKKKNYELTIRFENNSFICDNCLEKDFKNGRTFNGKYTMKGDF